MIHNPYKIVQMFEEEMAHYTGAPFAVSMNSCTNALFLACKWLDVKDKEGEYHTHRIDIDNAEEFPKNDFKAAIDKFYELLGQSNEN